MVRRAIVPTIVLSLVLALGAGRAHAEECGPLTAYGSCEGAVLRYCQDDVVVRVDCAAAFGEALPGVTCGLVAEDWGYDCMAGDGTCASDQLRAILPCPAGDNGAPQACVGDALRFGCAEASALCVEALLPACDGELRLDFCGVADQAIGVRCSYFSQVCRLDECVDDPGAGSCPNPPQRLDLRADEDVAAFAALGCDTVAGALRIEGDAVTSLADLEGLTTVRGSLTVLNTSQLLSLEGLHHLTSVGGELVIQGNSGLLDLRGLRGLEVAHGNVTVGFNDALSSLAGLDALRPVDATLSVVENDGLVRLDGLGEVQRLVDLSVRGNDALDAITGLRLLLEIDGGLSIVDNPALTAISGLGRLESLGGSLALSNNDVLTQPMSLAGIYTIGRNAVIAGNATLPTWPLVYLQSLGGNIEALDNPALPACAVDAAAEALRAEGWPGRLDNRGNDEAASCW